MKIPFAMFNKFKNHIIRTFLAKLLITLVLGASLVLNTGCGKLVDRYGVNRSKTYIDDPIQLANGSNSDQLDDDKKTRLHRAVKDGDVDMFLLLINDPNIDLNATYDLSKTLIYSASELDQAEFVKLLIEDGRANVNEPNYYGNRPIHVAVRLGHIKVVEALLKCPKIDINIKNKQRECPLYIAWKKNGMQQYMLYY